MQKPNTFFMFPHNMQDYINPGKFIYFDNILQYYLVAPAGSPKHKW